MGSGLILLVIVGAWLAVLVPMALRSHDTTTSLSSVDRFSDAMRVLSRRDAMARLRDRASAESLDDPLADPEELDEVEDVEELIALERRPRTSATVAQRRRRVLLVLLTLAAATLAGGLLGPVWLLGVHAGVDLLAIGYVGHLRRQALRRAKEAARRPAPRRRPAARPASRPAARPAARPAYAERSAYATRPAYAALPSRTVRVAGIPDRLPVRPAPLEAPITAPPSRYDEPVPVPAAVGEAWAPVPVPVPTYVTAPRAPSRPPTVLDLTRPGRYSDALREAEERLGIVDDGPELDHILERRRAVNEW